VIAALAAMKDQRAQALVEFALVLPVLVLLALALLTLAEVAVARLALEHAAAEGARTGALSNDDGLVHESIAAAAAPLDPEQVEVRIEPTAQEPPRTGNPRGSLLRVSLSYAVPSPLGLAGLPRPVVRGAAARRIEWSP
jgi:hypothetical protein